MKTQMKYLCTAGVLLTLLSTLCSANSNTNLLVDDYNILTSTAYATSYNAEHKNDVIADMDTEGCLLTPTNVLSSELYVESLSYHDKGLSYGPDAEGLVIEGKLTSSCLVPAADK